MTGDIVKLKERGIDSVDVSNYAGVSRASSAIFYVGTVVLTIGYVFSGKICGQELSPIGQELRQRQAQETADFNESINERLRTHSAQSSAFRTSISNARLVARAELQREQAAVLNALLARHRQETASLRSLSVEAQEEVRDRHYATEEALKLAHELALRRLDLVYQVAEFEQIQENYRESYEIRIDRAIGQAALRSRHYAEDVQERVWRQTGIVVSLAEQDLSISRDSLDTVGPGPDLSAPMTSSELRTPEQSELQAEIDQWRTFLPDAPEYLYDPATFSSAVAAVWTDLTEGVLGTAGLRAQYDDFYEAAVAYRTMAALELVYAQRFLNVGDDDAANQSIASAQRALQLFGLSNQGAYQAYLGNINAAAELARGVYKGSKAAAKYGAYFLGPTTTAFVDHVFFTTDFVVNSTDEGIDFATRELFADVVASAVLDVVPLDELGGRTISQTIDDGVTVTVGQSGLYEALGRALRSSAVRQQVMSVLADSSSFAAQEVAASYLEDVVSSIGAAFQE